MSPPRIDDGQHRVQEDASVLLLRVALRLLGEARLRGGFGDEAKLAERAVALADELTGGAPSPDPRRAPVEVNLIRPDRISLAVPFREGSVATWSLMLDGTLYDGATVGSARAVMIDPQTLTPEEQADLERRKTEWQARREREQQFTATDFVRAVVPPPQPDAATPVLALLLYEDGFYVEHTRDTEPPTFEPGMGAEAFFALRRDQKPEIAVEDDAGTVYFESGGGGWGGGVRVSHSSIGFAPAPPPNARFLRISTGDETVELDLQP